MYDIKRDRDCFYDFNLLEEGEYLEGTETEREDIETLLKFHIIELDMFNRLRWKNEKFLLWKYCELYSLCKQGIIFWLDNKLYILKEEQRY